MKRWQGCVGNLAEGMKRWGSHAPAGPLGGSEVGEPGRSKLVGNCRRLDEGSSSRPAKQEVAADLLRRPSEQMLANLV
jgi:hypothetical protein